MVTIKQNPTVHTQSKPLWKIISSQRKAATEEERNEGTTKQLENNKIALGSPYLSVITLNVNGLISSIKRCRMARWIKKRSNYVQPPGGSL